MSDDGPESMAELERARVHGQRQLPTTFVDPGTGRQFTKGANVCAVSEDDIRRFASGGHVCGECRHFEPGHAQAIMARTKFVRTLVKDYEWNPAHAGMVQEKYLINANTFPFGYVTSDDRWDNYWRTGSRSNLGWRGDPEGGGFGAKSLGREVAASRAFSVCQVEKVFAQVCFRPPSTVAEHQEVEDIADGFEVGGVYDLRQVFSDVAAYCAVNE